METTLFFIRLTSKNWMILTTDENKFTSFNGCKKELLAFTSVEVAEEFIKNNPSLGDVKVTKKCIKNDTLKIKVNESENFASKININVNGDIDINIIKQIIEDNILDVDQFVLNMTSSIEDIISYLYLTLGNDVTKIDITEDNLQVYLLNGVDELSIYNKLKVEIKEKILSTSFNGKVITIEMIK